MKKYQIVMLFMYDAGGILGNEKHTRPDNSFFQLIP